MLLYDHKNDARVVGSTVANGTMLRRSSQLPLMAENDHFEGIIHLKAKEEYFRYWVAEK